MQQFKKVRIDTGGLVDWWRKALFFRAFSGRQGAGTGVTIAAEEAADGEAVAGEPFVAEVGEGAQAGPGGGG